MRFTISAVFLTLTSALAFLAATSPIGRYVRVNVIVWMSFWALRDSLFGMASLAHHVLRILKWRAQP